MPKYRTQILLEPEQYRLLKQIAEARSHISGRRISLSAVARDLLNRALADEVLRREEDTNELLTGRGTSHDHDETENRS